MKYPYIDLQNICCKFIDKTVFKKCCNKFDYDIIIDLKIKLPLANHEQICIFIKNILFFLSKMLFKSLNQRSMYF